MTSKFEGPKGRGRLIDAITEQKFVGGSVELAKELAAIAVVRSIPKGTAIITQGAQDDTMYMILSGSFDVHANERFINKRWPCNTVGEMTAILPTQRRSATVTAAEDSDVAVIEESQLTAVAERYPFVWRHLAKELARRLLQRNALLTTPREKVRVFIISSAEGLEISRAVQNAFAHDTFLVQPWHEGVFRAAKYPIENLERELDQSDFAIAICQPDDLTTSRGKDSPTPRDNVIFELGFFMGRLGRHRAILLEPAGEEMKLPSDLSGIQTVSYRYASKPDLAAAIAPACNQLRDIFLELGPNL
jgi:CRP/FNR family cyclic AMP-dependent transcriptional regulator